jgi:hypothetical protein
VRSYHGPWAMSRSRPPIRRAGRRPGPSGDALRTAEIPITALARKGIGSPQQKRIFAASRALRTMEIALVLAGLVLGVEHRRGK